MHQHKVSYVWSRNNAVQARVDTVVDKETLKVQRESSFLGSGSVDDASGDVGDVVAGIALSRDEQLAPGKLREDGV